MPDNKDTAKELLFADYKYLTDSFWKNEETGETRVRFYITLVTAVLAAVATLLTKFEDALFDANILYVSIIAVAFLLAFGVITLLRIIKRNEVTDGYKKDLDDLRAVIRKHYDDEHVLEGYHPFGPGKVGKTALRRFGGLSHTVSTINSVIASMLIGMPFVQCGLYLSLVVTLLVFVCCMIVQYKYIRYEGRCSHAALHRGDFSHAGGVVYKQEDNLYFLIISANTDDGTEQWVIPKGHIKRCELAKETAVREVREETGVDAEIVDELEGVEYLTPKERVRSMMYLMKYKSQGRHARGEHRQQHWMPYDKAMAMLSYPESKQLLEMANAKLQETIGSGHTIDILLIET